ncbi:MAG: MarR family transcriptional regulator [Sporolactobacillus sp.]
MPSEREISIYSSRIYKAMMQLLVREANDDAEKTWLIAHSDNEQVRHAVSKLSVLALHTIDVIGKSEPIKGVDIADRLKVTKGAISKVTRRLLSERLIIREKKPENLKEIYFLLTETGRQLFSIHREMHQRLDAEGREVFKAYTADDMEIICDFLEKLSQITLD